MVVPAPDARAVAYATDSEKTTSKASDAAELTEDAEEVSDDAAEEQDPNAAASDDAEEQEESAAADDIEEEQDASGAAGSDGEAGSADKAVSDHHVQMVSADEFSEKGSYDNVKCLKLGLVNIKATYDGKRGVCGVQGRFTFHGVAPLRDVQKYPLIVRLDVKHGLLESRSGEIGSISIASLLNVLHRFKNSAKSAGDKTLLKKVKSASRALARLDNGSWSKKRWLFKRDVEMMLAQRWSDEMPRWERRFTRDFFDALTEGPAGRKRNMFLHAMNALLPQSYQRILELEDELAAARGGHVAEGEKDADEEDAKQDDEEEEDAEEGDEQKRIGEEEEVEADEEEKISEDVSGVDHRKRKMVDASVLRGMKKNRR